MSAGREGLLGESLEKTGGKGMESKDNNAFEELCCKGEFFLNGVISWQGKSGFIL